MNTIQKALRMLNESYKAEQEKRNLTEAVVDQDGDIEVLSFNLRDFAKDFLLFDFSINERMKSIA